MSEQLTSRVQEMRRLRAPFLLLLSLSFGILEVLVGLLTYAQNENAVVASEHTFDALMADRFKRMSNIVLEYGYWDEAVNMIVYTYDEEWVEGTFGVYFSDSLDIDGVRVVNDEQRSVVSFFRGKPDKRSLIERYGEGVLPIMARAREIKDDSSPWPKLGITKGEKHYFMIAALRMTTYLVEDNVEVDRSTDHVMFLAQRLDAGYLGMIARKYLMANLKIVDQPAGLWQADKEIKDLSGNVIGYFHWEPILPGNEMLPKIGLGVAVVFVIMGVTAWLFFKRVARAAGELEAARVTADDANRAKSDFLRNVAHEVRTPINAMVGFSTIMRDGMFGPVENERYQEYLADITGAGEHVQQLVSDLLDLSKIEAGEMSYEIEDVELTREIDATLTLIRPLADERKVALTFKSQIDDPVICSDQRAVRQVLINLLSNAIKFTPEGGSVDCRASEGKDGFVSISIIDTGKGVAPDQIEKIL